MNAENNNQTDKYRFVEEWVRLGDVATYINGYAFKPSDYSDTGLPIIRIQDLTGNAYQTNRYEGILSERYAVDDGDILISWSASLGVFEWDGGPAWLNQHIFKVSFDKMQVDKRFFVHQARFLMEASANLAHGATMRHLTKKVFDSLPFYFPRSERQRAIADQLDGIDMQLCNATNQLYQLDSLVKSRFVELINLGNASHRSVRDCCIYVSRGKSPNYADESDVLVVNQACIRQQGLDLSKAKRQIREKIGRARVLQPGDVLLNSTGTGTLGRTCVVPDVANTLIADSHVTIMTPDETIMLPAWLNCLMSLPNTQANLYRECVSGSTNQIELSKTKLLEFSIPVVNLALQQEFAALAQRVDKLRFAIQEQIEKLETLKASLMQEYFG